MKTKFLTIMLIIALAVIMLMFVNGQKTNLEQAKKDMENGEKAITRNAGENHIQKQETIQPEEKQEDISDLIVEAQNYRIEKVTSYQALEINEQKLSRADFKGDNEIVVEGKANDDVETISVEFSNLNSDFNNDTHKLQKYSKGDGTFKYFASPLYEVLDTGENVYLLIANGTEGESITKLTINIQKDAVKPQTFSGSISDIVFPKGNFGEARILDNTSAYYSDIKGLEIVKSQAPIGEVVCTAPTPIVEESETGSGSSTPSKDTPQHPITAFLVDSYSSWVYWNTCRPTIKDKGINFYVLRLDGKEDYSYEKHYIDYSNGLHGVLELETGTGVTKENIAERNSEFKEKEFEKVKITDELFEQIIIENKS